MTKEEFIQSFYKDYPYSIMTVKDMINIIESYPTDTMPFKIEDSWSWRGIYAHPCLAISTNESTKEKNLSELEYVLRYSYHGWKGGDFYYEESSLLHFETDWGNSTTYDEKSCYMAQFILNNEDNPFIQHMIQYFIDDKNVDVEYYQDVLGHDIREGERVVYYDSLLEKLSVGYIVEVNTKEKLVKVSETPRYLFKNEETPYQEITFDRIAKISDE